MKTLFIKRSQLRAYLDRLQSYNSLLMEIGYKVQNYGAEAFDKQAFGDKDWPAAYWGKGSPFINLAGAIDDLTYSPNIHADRLRPRPVLKHTGRLRTAVQNATISPGKDNVLVTVDCPYAGLHNEGGDSTQTITPNIKANLKIWLGANPNYSSRLSFLYNVNSVTTTVNARPFIGVNEEIENEFVDIVETYFSTIS